ncbi:hypothetical protein MLD38_001291 [Melastoma candidum]|uniref:Uncharacterized protein n=1 Tax=Melastoma candidum TaxID=119954 RepID=A0ACB9SCS8_9MYRT|nr:hypothetical protein MLD38_001291 [Melastoma candidum]
MPLSSMVDTQRTRSINSRGAGIFRRRTRTRTRKGLLRKRTTRAQGCAPEEVSEKLEALKELVPSTRGVSGDAVAAEVLFKETADYILRLKAQVVLLQKLIHIYGCSADQVDKNQNNVS